MTDIAGLGIRVATSGINEASAELDKLAVSSDKAAKSSEKVGKSLSNTQIFKANSALANYRDSIAKTAASAESLASTNSNKLAKSFSSSAIFKANNAIADYRDGLLSAKVASEALAAANAARAENDAKYAKILASSAISAVAAPAKARPMIDAASAAAFNASAMVRSKAIGEIDAAMRGNIASAEGMAAAELSLDRAMAVGAITAKEQQVYFLKLAEAEAAATVATNANTAANVRNASSFKMNSRLTKEFGTAITELASGNTGRLKYTAAAIANQSGLMAKAFSGTGLAVSAVVVALGTFAIAAFKGSEEADAFNKALITTGNYAGATSASLQDMARNMASNNATQGAAAEALAKVAASGRFTASQITLVGQAALDMSRLTGQSTEATIKQFESLQHAPVEALLKLNETQHFLTETIYEQIKALQDQGKEQDAATLAMQTYASSLSSRAKDVEDSAGVMVRAWHGVRDAAKEGWDTMLGIGRQETGQEKFDALAARRDQLISQQASGSKFDLNSGQDIQKMIDATTKAMSALQDARIKAQKDASRKSLIDQATQAAADSDAEVKEFATNAQKRNAEKLAAQGRADVRYAQAMAAGNKALAEKILSDEVKIQAGIEAKYKDPRKPHVKADPEINAYKAFSAQVDALNVKAISESSPALQKYEQGIAKLGDELNVYMSKNGDATKAAALFLTGQKALQAELDKDNAQNASALKTYQGSLDQQIADKQKQIDLQVSALSMGAKEAQQQQELAAIYSQVDKTIEQLNRARAQSGANVEYIDGEIAAQKASIPILVAQEKAKFSAMDRAQSSWEIGAKRAYANILDEAGNVAGQTDSLFTNAFDSMGNALADFASTGKLNFKGLVTSILADLAKMEVRIAASKILQSIVGAYMGGATYGGGTGAANGTGAYSGFGSSGTVTNTYNATGGVYTSPSLSQYSGQIVTQPTAFAFAKGAGIMGEAGPEAILPLSRGADGKLGVKAGGSSGDVSISQTFVIDSNGSTSDNTSGTNDDNMRQFAGKMKGIAQQAILEEQRPGGSLWRMRQGA